MKARKYYRRLSETVKGLIPARTDSFLEPGQGNRFAGTVLPASPQESRAPSQGS